MRAAIYARFSSQLQKDSSIEDQVRVCTERAAREGWQITEIFSDYAISGAVRDRPGLNALLGHVEAGKADIVLAEAIDRLSRDQEDLASIHKRVTFHGGRIVTLSEGAVDELQIGFKGTMASLFRKDLADKIRRGQSGRVAAGRIPGNIVYGYRKVVKLDARGEPERGLREIDPDQAEVVRRIYREYLGGESPLAIARRLNAEGIPSPSGRAWNVSAINGDSVRLNGILCNPIYVGELVFNRTTMVRDPVTRRRLPRNQPQELWQRVSVPDLQIVDRASWDAVRERKAEWSGWSFKSQRRPKRLLSDLVKCGCCGGNMVIVGAGKLGCNTARREGTCRNRCTIAAEMLERKVVHGIEADLLDPERIRQAWHAYRAERERLDKEERKANARYLKRLEDLDRQIVRMVEAVASAGDAIPELVEKLQALKAEQAGLQETLGDATAARVIMLHPRFAEAYQESVKQITTLLAGDDQESAEARLAMRALVDRVICTPRPEGRGMDVELEGRLAAMLDLGRGNTPTARRGTVLVVAEEGSTYGSHAIVIT